MTWGYIYIVRGETRYKIGLSGDLKTLNRRLKRLWYLNEHGIDVVMILHSRRPKSLETEIQELFATKHHHGEWYDLDDEDIDRIQQTYLTNLYAYEWEPPLS